MISLREIHLDYHDAVKNKSHNPDYVAFDLHRCANLNALRNDIDQRTLHPTSSAYVVFSPVIREVYSADIAQCTVEHRLERYLRPLIEAVINPRVFNNRIDMGLDRALNCLSEDIFELSNGYTEDCYVAVTDLSGYFPNADQTRSYRILEKLLLDSGIKPDLKDELIYLLRVSIFFNARASEKRSSALDWRRVPANKSLMNKPDGIGAAPGKIIMQMAMTYYHDEVIKWILSCGVRVTVYGDDFAFVFKDKEQFLRLIMPEFRARMAAIGCQVHKKKFYCQHYTKGARFCSQMVKPGRVYAGNRTVYNFFRKIRYWNNKMSLRNVERMASSLNSYFGILRNRQGYAILRRGYETLSPQWKKFIELKAGGNTLTLRKGYKHSDLICIIHKLNLYDNARTNWRPRVQTA